MDNQTDNAGPQNGTPGMPPLRTLDLIDLADPVEGADDSAGGTALEASPASEPETKPTVISETGSGGTLEKLSSKKTLTVSELDQLCELSSSEEFIVDGMLPTESVAIACGESTIGKSPFFYQLGLCVASGRPFLGMDVAEKGRVLYIDLENSLLDSQQLRNRLTSYLGVDGKIPDDMFQVSMQHANEKTIGEFLDAVKPTLTVIDSLRSYCPSASAGNEKAGEVLGTLKMLARKYHTTFVVVHHPRKTQKPTPGSPVFTHPLEESTVEEFLQQMEGARALVNQTDVRIAMEAGDENPIAVRFKWNRRVHGDSPLYFVERTLDVEGEPLGYRKLEGQDFLKSEHREAFGKLGEHFSFGDAQKILGGTGKSTAQRFLASCLSLGLIKRLGERRGYVKRDQDAAHLLERA